MIGRAYREFRDIRHTKVEVQDGFDEYDPAEDEMRKRVSFEYQFRSIKSEDYYDWMFRMQVLGYIVVIIHCHMDGSLNNFSPFHLL